MGNRALKLWNAASLGLLLCGASGALAEDFAMESVCTDAPTVVPLENRGGAFIDLAGHGQFIAFGDAAKVCVGEQQIYVDAGEQRVIECVDVETDPSSGMGHEFKAGETTYRLWFYIDTDKIPTRLEIGLYEASAESPQYYWIATGQKICAKTK